jgi:hypothetical protein
MEANVPSGSARDDVSDAILRTAQVVRLLAAGDAPANGPTANGNSGSSRRARGGKLAMELAVELISIWIRPAVRS